MNRLRQHMPEVRAVAARSELDSRSDADLLERFARYGEHAAFEVLLRRHAAVVHGVCRRMLANPADADDAFQATFLVLLRRAGSVRGERLGPWLYGVAVRVSLKARSFAARDAARHTEATDMIPDPNTPNDAADWLPILDAELAAIPAKYREPMVLCELQGLSRAAAAKVLGIREGTLSSRLSRGREMLRKQLLRHGTLLPAGGLTVLLSNSGSIRGAVPAGLMARTVDLVAGAGFVGVVPAGPARLTDEVVKSMFLTKLKAVSGAALAVGLVAVGLIAASPADVPAQAKDATKPVSKAPAVKAEGAKAKPADGPDEKLVQGYWQLSKYDFPPKATPPAAQLAELTKHTWLLVEGDTWWIGGGNRADRFVVKLDPHRNPKFIDTPTIVTGNTTHLGLHGIYRLTDGRSLEICLGEGEKKIRPAEFAADDDLGSCILRFERGAFPDVPAEKRAAREKLHGEWGGTAKPAADGVALRTSIVFTTYIAFLFEGDTHSTAYTYDLDTDKNPPWIDLVPVMPDGPDAPKPLFGVYQVGEKGQFKLALGSGKRIARPLEFVDDKARDVRVMDLTRSDIKTPPK